ncbi:hypothetical protein ACJ7C5_17690 [Nocardiopsis yanglingensis]
MEYALLKSLRALAPGLMILAYFDLTCTLTLGYEFSFWKMDASKLLLCGYIAGGIYGLLVGKWASEAAFGGVNERVRDRLISVVPDLRGKSWSEISPHFYALLDSDKSLEIKSKGVFFNGLLVTSSYCGIWISLAASILGSGLALGGKGGLVLHVSLVAVVLCYLLWRKSIKRHLELVDGQLNVIARRLVPQLVRSVNVGLGG